MAGSVSVPDDRLKEYETIVCSEVIEHLFDKDLEPFLDVALGFYKPRVLIVTTPNGEYNVHFPDLQYGTEHAIFRHDDHKFEWTRQQFQNWCSHGATKYGYDMEFHGIGLMNSKLDDLKNGHCTQACIFIRRDDCITNTASAGESHELIKHFEFPYYDEPLKPENEILQEIYTFIEVLCRADYYAHTKKEEKSKEAEDTFDLDDFVDWNTFNIKEKENLFITQEVKPQDNGKQLTVAPLDIPILQLWDISRVRQLCKTVERLNNLLTQNQDPLIYTMSEDKLIVKKAFIISQD
ncbi:hypothetical protein G6F56_005386 [Rhizopus delemar]|nr:hypothetical protein G6F56_005386 [Rhizopus delemar]